MYVYIYIYIYIYTLLPISVCKEPEGHAGVDGVMLSGKIGGVMARISALNARSVGSNPALGAVFPIVVTSMNI